MRQKRLFIEVSPARIEVAVVRGRAVEARRSGPLEPGDWNENWPGLLKPLTERLKALLASLGSDCTTATVLYAAPRCAAGVFSCPASTGRRAEDAARLALSDAAGFDIDSNPCAIERLLVESGRAAQGAPAPQIHLLGAADLDSSVAAVAAWAASAGVHADEIIPIAAPALAETVHRAMQSSASGPVAVLRLGDHESVLAAAGDERLRFVRTVGVGFESLVGVLAREVRPASGDSPSITLDRSTAATLLYRAGIPQRGAEFDASLGLRAEAVLPLLQPILQRLVVETKQSLRFGLGEAERSQIRLELIGAGAAVPRLGRVIAEQTGLALDPGTSVPGPTESRHAIDSYLDRPWCGLSLRPLDADQALGTRRLVRSLWVGVGVAAAWVVAQGLFAGFELRERTDTLAFMDRALAAASKTTALSRQASDIRAAIGSVRQRIAGSLGESAPWDSVLTFLAQATPPEVRLTDLELKYDAGKPTCRLAGIARARVPGDPAEVIKSYLGAISSAPIVASARLGGTQRSESDGWAIQQFQVSLSIVGLPAEAVDGVNRSPAAAASAETGGSP